MYVCLLICLAIPDERTPRKVNMNARGHKRAPQVGNLLPLSDGVGGYHGGTNCRILLHHLQWLFVPSCNIVHISDVFPFCTKDGDEIVFLLDWHNSRSKERRIPHYIIQIFSWYNLIPVHPQRISLVDIIVGLKWQRIEVESNNFISLSHHLALGNPKRSLGHGTGEVIDFNPVELIDWHLDWVGHLSNQTVVSVNNSQSLIFQSAKAGVSFRKKIATATSRVKELQPRNFILKGISQFLLDLEYGCGLDVGHFGFELIQEQRVNHLVYVLYAGVMHTAGPTCRGV